MGQQVLPSSCNILIKVFLAAAVSPVQGFVCEQFLPEQSPLISAPLLPGSQVSQQAVACHLSQVPQLSGTQQAGTFAIRYLKQEGIFAASYLTEQASTHAGLEEGTFAAR